MERHNLMKPEQEILVVVQKKHINKTERKPEHKICIKVFLMKILHPMELKKTINKNEQLETDLDDKIKGCCRKHKIIKQQVKHHD